MKEKRKMAGGREREREKECIAIQLFTLESVFTNIGKEERIGGNVIGLMIHRNRMGWRWLTVPFVSSNCPPLVNVIRVAKVTRHY